MGEEGPSGAPARAQVGKEGHQGDSAALQPPRLRGSVVPAGMRILRIMVMVIVMPLFMEVSSLHAVHDTETLMRLNDMTEALC